MPSLGKKGKVILSVVGLVILAAIIVSLVISNRYSQKIKQELPGRISKITDGLYQISVKRVHVNIFTRSITLKDAHIYLDSTVVNTQLADSTAPKLYYDIRIPKLKVSQLMWDKLVGGKGFSCSRFKIFSPKIEIWQNDTTLQKNKDTSSKPIKRELSTGEIAVEGGRIWYHISPEKEDKDKMLYFAGLHISLTDWKINEETIKDSTRFLFAEVVDMEVDTFKYLDPEFDYNFIVRQLAFNSSARKLTAGDITLKLKSSKTDFYTKHKVQKEIYDIHFPTFELTKVNWRKLLSENILEASTLYLNRSSINVLFDRRLLESNENKLGKYPNQLLYKLSLPVYIAAAKANDCNVTYSEVSERTGQEASINFTRITGDIKNITNIQEVVDTNNICTAKLNAKFNKYTDINAEFEFTLNDEKGKYAVDVEISGLQGHQINKQTKAFTMITVKSLNLRQLTMKLHGDETYSKGDFKMLYNNLSIKVLKEDSDNKKQKRKKGFITFIANNLILYSNNPMPGSSERTVNTYVKRAENKSFFNQIWRNIHQGVQETTIRDIDVIEWFRKQEQENKARNKRRQKQVFTPEEE